MGKNLASFETSRLPSVLAVQLNALLEGSFVERSENVLAFGNPGSGKTHLLCAIAQELIHRQGRRLPFSPCSLLVQQLLVAKRDLKLPRVLKSLSKYEVIIIDDIGYPTLIYDLSRADVRYDRRKAKRKAKEIKPCYK